MTARFHPNDNVINVRDFGAKGDGVTDDSAAIQAAIGGALAKTNGAKIIFPAGNYIISSSLTVTMTATQSLLFRGDGAGNTTISQSADADMFDVSIVVYTTKNGELVGFEGITLNRMNATADSSAIKISSTANGGQQGLPLYVKKCAFLGAWNFGIDITRLPTRTFIETCEFFNSSNTTSISFKGDSVNAIYGVGLQVNNCNSWNGNRFLYVGPYVQGVIVNGCNVGAATQAAIEWDASSGAGEQLIVNGCYLDVAPGVYLHTSGSGTLAGVNINGCFFDGIAAATNHVQLVGLVQTVVSGNVFFGPGTVGGVAVTVTGCNGTSISGNSFSGFAGGSGNGLCVNIDSTSHATIVSGNSAINCAAYFIDDGTHSAFADNALGTNDAHYVTGIPGDNRSILGDSGTLRPGITSVHALGASTFRWSNVFSAGIDCSGAITTSSFSGNASIEHGSISASSTPFFDWHSSGNNIDYDFRMLAGGGSASVGLGNMTFTGSTLTLACDLKPTHAVYGNTNVVTAAGNYTATTTDNVIIIKKATGAATTVTLPSSPATGRMITVKDGKGDSSTNNITIQPATGTIDGAASIVLNQNYSSVDLIFDGTNWGVI